MSKTQTQLQAGLMTDVIIMSMKFYVMSDMTLIRAYTGEVYGVITKSHLNKLLKNNK